ncbi:MAG: trigger factor [Rhodobacteraceae bacterium]|nr:trigger factor [Paracoccaceae bacterium]
MDRQESGPRALDDFLGRWQVMREITGRPGPARFEGEAEISPIESGARYAETGILTLAGGQAFRAERVYLWSRRPGGIAVSFDDGRPFHEIGLNGSRPEARHPCGADLYRVAYDFTRWPDWDSRWDVTGPAKDYRIVTRYRRLIV